MPNCSIIGARVLPFEGQTCDSFDDFVHCGHLRFWSPDEIRVLDSEHGVQRVPQQIHTPHPTQSRPDLRPSSLPLLARQARSVIAVVLAVVHLADD